MFSFFRVLIIGFLLSVPLNAGDIQGFRHSTSSAAASASFVQGAVTAKVENGKIVFKNDRYESVEAFIHDANGNIISSHIIPGSVHSYYTAAWSMIKATTIRLFYSASTFKDFQEIIEPAIKYFENGSALVMQTSLDANSFPDGSAISYVSGTKKAIVSTSVSFYLRGLVSIALGLTSSDDVSSLGHVYYELHKAFLADPVIVNAIANELENIDNATKDRIAKLVSDWFSSKGVVFLDAYMANNGGFKFVLAKAYDSLTYYAQPVALLGSLLVEASYKRDVALAKSFGPIVLWYDMSYGSDNYLKPTYKMNWLGAESPLNQHDAVTFLGTKNTYDSSLTWWNPFTWNDPFQAEYERYSYQKVTTVGQKTAIETLLETAKTYSGTTNNTVDAEGNDLLSIINFDGNDQVTFDGKKLTIKKDATLIASFKNFTCNIAQNNGANVKFWVQYDGDTDKTPIVATSSDNLEFTLKTPKEGTFGTPWITYEETYGITTRQVSCGAPEKMEYTVTSIGGGTSSQGLIARYEFEDNANDSSGNTNHGVSYGGISYVAGGVHGKAAQFNGTDGYIKVENSSTFPNNAITMSYWVKRDSLPTMENYLSKELSFQSYLKSNGHFESGFWKGTPGYWSGYSVDANLSLPANNWILYTFSFDNSTKTAKSYVNGELISSQIENDASAYLRTSSHPLYIGRNGSANVYYIKGLVDDVRIYNRVLSDNEIKGMYSVKDGLVAHYEFEGNANDSSGNGNNGAEYGGVTYVDGVFEKAAKFSGNGSKIEIPNNNSLNPTTSLTLSAWVDFSVGGMNNPRIISKDSISGTGYEMWTAAPNYSGAYSNRRGVGSEMAGVFLHDIGNIYSNKWHHIVSVYGVKKLTMYVDGINVGEQNTTQDISSNNGSLWIGNRRYNSLDEYIGLIDDVRIYNRALSESEIAQLYEKGIASLPPAPSSKLLTESPQDYAIQTQTFTKTWRFSLANGSVSDLHINTLSNSGFTSYGIPSIIDEGSGKFRIEMSLAPDHANPINKLTLELRDKNDNIVKVSGSETFWAVVRTNNPPRFNAAQMTHIAGESGTPMRIKLLGEDLDNDPISYSLVSNGGGVVSIQNGEVQATFSDNSVCHEVKVALSDGKESITKSLSFLTFTPTNLKEFYQDVYDHNSSWQEIYFATLKGIAIGEEGNTTCKRKFRPYDDVTWAEALKMISLSVAKANDLTLPKHTFAVAGPSWVRPYYTFAKLRGALDDNVSMYDHPTREQMGTLVSKLLELESFDEFNLTKIDFGDKALFSSEEAHQSALLTKLFGLYMTGSNALPNMTVKRDEVAEIAANILRMPKGEFDVPSSIEYGDTLTLKGIKNLRATAILTLGEQTIKEEWISSPKEYVTLDVATGQTLLGKNLSLESFSPLPIPTPPQPITLIGMLHNSDGNVRNILKTVVDVNYTDTDGDGVQDKTDKWVNDARYSIDTNNNGIPDIIDSLYNTNDKNTTDTILINGKTASIAQIITDGGIDIAKYYPEIAMSLQQGWSLRGLGADINASQNQWNALFGSSKVVWKYKDSTWKAYSSLGEIKSAITTHNIASFESLSAGEGIWIHSDVNTTVALDVNETVFQLSIPTVKGWHLKATPKELIVTSFTANRTDITYVWAYRNGMWKLWTRDGVQKGFTSLDTLFAHEGFWVFVK